MAHPECVRHKLYHFYSPRLSAHFILRICTTRTMEFICVTMLPEDFPAYPFPLGIQRHRGDTPLAFSSHSPPGISHPNYVCFRLCEKPKETHQNCRVKKLFLPLCYFYRYSDFLSFLHPFTSPRSTGTNRIKRGVVKNVSETYIRGSRLQLLGLGRG